jgi:hypothetical protein
MARGGRRFLTFPLLLVPVRVSITSPPYSPRVWGFDRSLRVGGVNDIPLVLES